MELYIARRLGCVSDGVRITFSGRDKQPNGCAYHRVLSISRVCQLAASTATTFLLLAFSMGFFVCRQRKRRIRRRLARRKTYENIFLVIFAFMCVYKKNVQLKMSFGSSSKSTYKTQHSVKVLMTLALRENLLLSCFILGLKAGNRLSVCAPRLA